MPHLKINDEHGERTIEIAKPSVTIGRASENEVQVFDTESSRRHCQIEQGDWGFKLVDLESRNGTKVNGRVVNQHLLNHGDVINIGKATLEFVAPNLRPAPVPVPVSAPMAAGVTGPTAPMTNPPPGADDIKIVSSSPPPKVRMAPRRPGSTVQGMTPEEREDLNKKLREQAIIKNVCIAAGVIVGALVLMLAYKAMSAKSPQESAAKRDWDAAVALQDTNPSGAIEILKRIPPSVQPTYNDAQVLIKKLEDKVASQEANANADLVKMYEEIDNYIQKYPTKYDDHESRLNEFEKKWKDEMPVMYQNWLNDMRRRVRDGRIAARADTLKDLQEGVEKSLKDKEFDEALTKIDRKRDLFKTDPTASELIVGLHTRVHKEATAYFNDIDAQVKQLADGGKKDQAAALLTETVERYRHPEFDTLRQAMNTRIRALE